jgi:ribosomal-protein-alanine N-acetyltransferase
VTQGSEEIVVRAMSLDDIPTVVEIDRLSFPVPWPERTYRYELTENPAAHLFVAQIAGQGSDRVVGYVGFWLIADEAHISTLAVHPNYRRRGVGARLLRAALERASGLGAEIATLEVRVSNQVAVTMYQGSGFRVAGRRARYYRDNGEDALVMTLHGLREGQREKIGGGGG